jgi:hypothetical protein
VKTSHVWNGAVKGDAMSKSSSVAAAFRTMDGEHAEEKQDERQRASLGIFRKMRQARRVETASLSRRACRTTFVSGAHGNFNTRLGYRRRDGVRFLPAALRLCRTAQMHLTFML